MTQGPLTLPVNFGQSYAKLFDQLMALVLA